MSRLSRRNGLLCLTTLLLIACFSPVFGQFGMPKKSSEENVAEVVADGHVVDAPPLSGVAAQLIATNDKTTEQEAVDIAAVIDSAKADPETMVMIDKMKHGDGQEALTDFAKDMAPAEIAMGLKQALDEILMLEVLFKDKERALKTMEEEGVIDKKRLSACKKNPDLLEEDTRKGLFFQFCSLAAAGGYLQKCNQATKLQSKFLQKEKAFESRVHRSFQT